ncbi:transmembrane protein 120A-like [Denticeps clupeoides]|uniref:transmembrane protein 120A-like n=1 Tax=Denticeps clupeoides TaxID=299321 RepID=UPI0010A3C85E|nr:transmembrane protein 120A-like [Denticeps clupeoides]
MVYGVDSPALILWPQTKSRANQSAPQHPNQQHDGRWSDRGTNSLLISHTNSTGFPATMSAGIRNVFRDWEGLDREFQQIQETHRVYMQKLDDVSKLQLSFAADIKRHGKNQKDLSRLMEKSRKGLSEEDAKKVDMIKSQMKEWPRALLEMEAFLPKKNGLYLSLVLGSVNVNLPSKSSKGAYKDEYEQFKLYVTVVLLVLASLCLFALSYRFVDALLNFLLVWFYCTLTIRESILISNGSRIKGWWVVHHYVATFLSGVMLTWPDGNSYQMFRNQFLSYSMYQSFLQFLQYYYQSGCLYRLRALGQRHNLDLTVEGFQSWMWRGLTFLLPFLFFGHFWQLYNGVSLIVISRGSDCVEWQVSVAAVCFVLLFLGNFSTTLAVVRHKLQSQKKPKSP